MFYINKRGFIVDILRMHVYAKVRYSVKHKRKKQYYWFIDKNACGIVNGDIDFDTLSIWLVKIVVLVSPVLL